MNSNKKTFDELWNRPATVGLGVRCPLDDRQLEQMVAKAVAAAPMAGAATARRSLSSRLALPLGIAASVALLLIPLTRKSYAATLPTVPYGNQEVRFVCNHECAPEGVIDSFNSYVDQL
ncbi:MAG: hypothetical protein IJ634_06935 [Bacteroidales bacterium]|nr:hypothetical protein [Bacteroidales bacterium]